MQKPFFQLPASEAVSQDSFFQLEDEDEEEEEEELEEEDEEIEEKKSPASLSPSIIDEEIENEFDIQFDFDFGEQSLSDQVKKMISEEKDKWKERYELRRKQFKTNYIKKRDELRQRAINAQKKLKAEMQKPTFIRKKDKIAFTMGVTITVITAFILGRIPQFIPTWYLIWATLVNLKKKCGKNIQKSKKSINLQTNKQIIMIMMTIIIILIIAEKQLLSTRFVMYHREKYHYFMLDFCYFSNLLLLFYLFYYPTSGFLFVLSFVNSNGPLLWAIITWRNSLVFHDLDKVTSVFIHAFPPLVTFVIRWFPLAREGGALYNISWNPDGSISLLQIFIPHVIFFGFWQITYILKTEVIDKSHLDKNENLVTSLRWTLKSPESLHYRVIHAYGKKFVVAMFVCEYFIPFPLFLT